MSILGQSLKETWIDSTVFDVSFVLVGLVSLCWIVRRLEWQKLKSRVRVIDRIGIPGLALVSLAFASIWFLQSPHKAEASASEDLKAICRPASFSAPTARFPRTANAIEHKAPVKILAIGSSSTEGIGATEAKFAYPAQLMVELNSLNHIVNVDVRNAGIGGETIEQTLTRLENELNTYKPDLVLWQVGTNDAIGETGRSTAFQKLIDVGIKSIKQHKADVMLIDQQFYLKIPDLARYERFVDYVHTAAETNDVAVFPRYKLMKAWNSLPGGVTPMLGPDGFHMGNRGYSCLANLIADQIVKSVDRTGMKVATP